MISTIWISSSIFMMHYMPIVKERFLKTLAVKTWNPIFPLFCL